MTGYGHFINPVTLSWRVHVRVRSDRIKRTEEVIKRRNVVAFEDLLSLADVSEPTLRRDVASLDGISSFTHNGRYISLPSIPCFDENGIWFSKKVGFTKFKNSLELIVNLIDNSSSGITKENLDSILRIDTYKQINTLLQREQIHRIKTGRKYLYLPESLVKNRKKRLRLLPNVDIEECHQGRIKTTDLIALLKAVLLERKIDLDERSIGKISRKYALKLPAKKMEQLLRKYELSEKKTPSH